MQTTHHLTLAYTPGSAPAVHHFATVSGLPDGAVAGGGNHVTYGDDITLTADESAALTAVLDGILTARAAAAGKAVIQAAFGDPGGHKAAQQARKAAAGIAAAAQARTLAASGDIIPVGETS